MELNWYVMFHFENILNDSKLRIHIAILLKAFAFSLFYYHIMVINVILMMMMMIIIIIIIITIITIIFGTSSKQ